MVGRTNALRRCRKLIGRKVVSLEFSFDVPINAKLPVTITRPDTAFGVTFRGPRCRASNGRAVVLANPKATRDRGFSSGVKSKATVVR